LLCFYNPCHDVSIRIDDGHGEALCRGVWPRWKTSMMRILLRMNSLAERRAGPKRSDATVSFRTNADVVDIDASRQT